MQLHFAAWVSAVARAEDTLRAPERSVVRLGDGSLCVAYVKEIPPREITVEITCALLGGILGLPIPDPVLVWMPGDRPLRFGSTMIDAPPFIRILREDRAALGRLKKWPQIAPAACFDEWIVNADRNLGNVLHDGVKGFWLIDHGQALPPTHNIEALCERNVLLDVASVGATETELSLKLRPQLLGTMQTYAQSSPRIVRKGVDGAPLEAFDEVIALLEERQPHLLRFVAQRLPQAQRDMFHGDPS